MPDTAARPHPPKRGKPAKGGGLRGAQVLAYLQTHPEFFQKHHARLETLVVPKKGGNILSLHALKADKLAREAENMKIRHNQLISTARGNALVAEGIFAAVLGLIRCRTVGQLRKFLQTTLADQLDLAAVRLFGAAAEESATTLTAAQIQALCPAPVTLAPLDAARHRPLFGPRTSDLKSVCLLALTTAEGGCLGLLALGSAEAARFHAGQATDLAEFFRQATATVYAHAAPASR